MDLYSIINVLKNLEEGSMTSAEKHSDGPEFTGYWKGTDKATPGNHMVGASESAEQSTMSPLEQKLRAKWAEVKQGLQEVGMTTGGMNGMSQAAATNAPVDPNAQAQQTPQQQAQKVAQTQQSVNKLKSAGVNIPNTSQAVKSTMRDPATPASQQDKDVAMGMGQNIEQLINKGDPNDVNKLADMIKRANVGGAQ